MTLFSVKLLIAVCFHSFVLVECDPLPPSCYPCTSSLKREWEQGTCDGTSGDCGQCLEGYSGRSDGPCEPLSVVSINESKIVFVPRNATVFLECVFNQSITECVWERQGYDVEINNRYKYKEKNEGNATITDCSISITGFKDFDVGEWKCSSAATESTFSNPNINAYLHMTQGNIVTLNHNREASFPVGESVILKCYFEQEVDCAWEHRHNATEVGDRYKYISDNIKAKNTKYCSIHIDNIRDIDFGLWDCKGMPHGSTNVVWKSVVWLSKAKPATRIGVHSNTSTSRKPSIEAVPCPVDKVNQPNNSLHSGQKDSTTDHQIRPYDTNTEFVVVVVLLALSLILHITTSVLIFYWTRTTSKQIDNGAHSKTSSYTACCRCTTEKESTKPDPSEDK